MKPAGALGLQRWLQRWVILEHYKLENSTYVTHLFYSSTKDADNKKGYLISKTTKVISLPDQDSGKLCHCFSIETFDTHDKSTIHWFSAENSETKTYLLLCLETIISSQLTDNMILLHRLENMYEISCRAVNTTEMFIDAWIAGTPEKYQLIFKNYTDPG
jgi:hypothetical protein